MMAAGAGGSGFLFPGIQFFAGDNFLNLRRDILVNAFPSPDEITEAGGGDVHLGRIKEASPIGDPGKDDFQRRQVGSGVRPAHDDQRALGKQIPGLMPEGEVAEGIFAQEQKKNAPGVPAHKDTDGVYHVMGTGPFGLHLAEQKMGLAGNGCDQHLPAQRIGGKIRPFLMGRIRRQHPQHVLQIELPACFRCQP